MTVSAEIICDSLSNEGVRLTTMKLRYPRFIHAEVMTHRAFSRNAASSRAIPIHKMIDEVIMNPALPERFGLNGTGMQDHGAMSDYGARLTCARLMEARDYAVAVAKQMLLQEEVPHKQIVNRILEPFMHITTLITATEWKNFFALRNHPAADPTFQALAAKMEQAYVESTPMVREAGDWHLPFITVEDVDTAVNMAMEDIVRLTTGVLPTFVMGEDSFEYMITQLVVKQSVARCARVSYNNFDGKRSKLEDDVALYGKLTEAYPIHASPLEHCATPDARGPDGKWQNKYQHGNFIGWCQHRKMIVGENLPTNKE